MVVNSQQSYQKALKQLLPPGDFWVGADVDKITAFQSAELARIDNEINRRLTKIKQLAKPRYDLDSYRQILALAGLTDFVVNGSLRLGAPFVCGKSKAGHFLGDRFSRFKIFIFHKKSQKQLFENIKQELKKHNLAHTIIIVSPFYQFITGATKCQKSSTQIF